MVLHDHAPATEDNVAYATRAGPIFERLKTVWVPTASLPSAPQQGRRFIDGLSDSTLAYVDYKSYLRHSKDCTDTDIYPKTLVAAINGATLFYRGAKSNSTIAPAGGSPYTALGAKGRGKPGGSPKGTHDTKKDNCSMHRPLTAYKTSTEPTSHAPRIHLPLSTSGS